MTLYLKDRHYSFDPASSLLTAPFQKLYHRQLGATGKRKAPVPLVHADIGLSVSSISIHAGLLLLGACAVGRPTRRPHPLDLGSSGHG